MPCPYQWPHVDNAKLRSLAGLHPADATKILRSLRDRGYLAMIGWGRGASYQLGASAGAEQADSGSTERLAAPAARTPSLRHSAENLVTNEPNLVINEQSLATTEPSWVINEQSPANNEQSSETISLSAEPRGATPAESSELLRVAARARMQRRMPKGHVAQIIVTLCGAEPLSVHELATLVERDPHYVRKLVRDLVAHGQVQPLYPQRNHPNQRYAVQSNETTEA